MTLFGPPPTKDASRDRATYARAVARSRHAQNPAGSSSVEINNARAHLTGEHAVLSASEKLLREHLDEYLAGARGRAARDARGDAASEPYEPTYEAWIACLHPENAHEDGRIDERFYHEQSDHRRLWNAAAPPGSARRVAGIALADMPSQAAESLECI